MSSVQAESIVTSFNDSINERDIVGLSNLMTDDHVFIDAGNNSISGKERCIAAWMRFFAALPDYRNVFEQVLLTGGNVVIVGHSVCSDMRLAGPALWTAKISGALVAEWRVHEDTAANRALLDVVE